MSRGSSSTWAGACRQQCQRNNSCPGQRCPRAHLLLLPLLSMPPTFKTSCSQAQRKGWHLPHGSRQKKAQHIWRDKHTVLQTLPRRAGRFGRARALVLQHAQAECSNTHIHSSWCPGHRRVSYVFLHASEKDYPTASARRPPHTTEILSSSSRCLTAQLSSSPSCSNRHH